MNREQLILGTLLSLFDLANDLGHSESVRMSRLAGRLGVTPTAVGAALLHLEERQLVDAVRVRLTLRGLAVATAFRARQSAGVQAAA
jgi:DNA-binding MarR family transcriptional regulator